MPRRVQAPAKWPQNCPRASLGLATLTRVGPLPQPPCRPKQKGLRGPWRKGPSSSSRGCSQPDPRASQRSLYLGLEAHISGLPDTRQSLSSPGPGVLRASQHGWHAPWEGGWAPHPAPVPEHCSSCWPRCSKASRTCAEWGLCAPGPSNSPEGPGAQLLHSLDAGAAWGLLSLGAAGRPPAHSWL